AARDVGINVGPRIEKARFPRARTNGQRKTKPPKAENPPGGTQKNPPPPTGDHISDKALEYKLIDLMREPGVGQQEREAIWTLVQYLTAKATKKAASEQPTAS